MGAMTAMITGACLSFSGNGHDACTKAAEAGAKQSGFEQTIDSTEKTVTQKADAEAHELLGEDGIAVAGSTVFLAKTVMDKKVHIDLPNFGICKKMSTDIAMDKATLKLEWGF